MRPFSRSTSSPPSPSGQPGRGRPRRGRGERRGDAAVRALDQPLGDDVPAPPHRPAADYRLRIFTPSAELPFAGHPTIGSAHAWLEAGGEPREEAEIVQECGAGLVRVRRGRTARLRGAAAAPRGAGQRRRARPGSSGRSASARTTSSTSPGATTALAGWWCCCATRTRCSPCEPDWSSFGGLDIGVVGPYRTAPTRVEVRAFCPRSAWSRTR